MYAHTCCYVNNIYVHSILYFTLKFLGTAPITNGIAIVTVNGLECGVTYSIIAGGTLNGDLVGPRSSHGNINMGPCPLASNSLLCIKHLIN